MRRIERVIEVEVERLDLCFLPFQVGKIALQVKAVPRWHFPPWRKPATGNTNTSEEKASQFFKAI